MAKMILHLKSIHVIAINTNCSVLKLAWEMLKLLTGNMVSLCTWFVFSIDWERSEVETHKVNCNIHYLSISPIYIKISLILNYQILLP